MNFEIRNGCEQPVDPGQNLATLAAGPTDQAESVVTQLRANPLFGKLSGKTDWESLKAGMVNAGVWDEAEYAPTIITSVGGAEGAPAVAAGFNIVPALELSRALATSGYSPKLIISSAGEYAINCNDMDASAVTENWLASLAIYERILSTYYPDLEEDVTFEYLDPDEREYPLEIESALREAAMEERGLLAKARSMGGSEEDFVEYMASHIFAFRDFQPDPERRFVIKVGAQSEERFSRFQKTAIEKCLPGALDLGFVPNLIRPDDSYYGQITLYYPRIGSRPPYYLEADGDPSAADLEAETYADLLDGLDDELLLRYQNLEKALGKTSISPDEYLAVVRAGE